jgi:hypothetical protein
MDETTLRVPGAARAEDVLPPRYTSTLQALAAASAEEPAGIVTKDNAAEEIQRLLKDADRRRGTIAVALGVLGTGTNTAKERASAARLASHAEQELTHIGDRLRTALRAVGLLIPALLVAVGLAVGGPSVGHAEAAEGPQPDPVASQAVRVTLGTAPVTAWVRASVYTPVARGWWCASVWTARGRIGGTCSIGRTFPVPIVVDPRTFPVGRTFAQVVDDASDVAVSNVTIDARRPSRFGRGTWLDLGRGDEFVSAPLAAYTASVGAWTPQRYSPVQVQELVAGRWIVRATLTTTAQGVASRVVHLGGGVHRVRVVRPAGATVWSTRGTTRTVVVTTEPLDII